MLISELINNGSQILKKNNIFSHLLDSELIISSILKKSREKLLTTSDQEVTKQTVVKFNYFIERRLKKNLWHIFFKKKNFGIKNF